MLFSRRCLFFLFILAVPTAASARESIDLSGAGWKLWLDRSAAWRNDTLYVPAPAASKLATPCPTGGWKAMLENPKARAVSVPGTVEEYFWGADGDPHGLAGNYQGVSYWWRDFTVPKNFAGPNFVLKFDACRLRAEVYLDDKLVGYDAVGNTPFEVDLTGMLTPGSTHRLAVRITDPNDNTLRLNFDWADYGTIAWGPQRVPSSHGFGGITGRVRLESAASLQVADIFVRNKPSPSANRPTDVDIEIELRNRTDQETRADLELTIHRKGAPEDVVFRQRIQAVLLKPGSTTVSYPASAPRARVWDLDSPNLYQCEVALTVIGNKQPADDNSATFGFRWFSADTPAATTQPIDPMLRLNGRRIFAIGAITWSYYPVNGMFPTPDIVQRQVENAKKLGLNMINYHRMLADPAMLDKADELGLLIYEEPGGYKGDQGDAFTRKSAREKLLRMIRRDRNHPSVVIYCMLNEIFIYERRTRPEYFIDMRDAFQLDPTRTLVLTSGQMLQHGRLTHDAGSWMNAGDPTRRETGWSDEHRAGSPGVYVDDLYSSPESLYGNEGPEDQIIFWGEEGSLPSPPPLERMAQDYKRIGLMGWDGDDYLQWRDAYRDWLTTRGALDAMHGVDGLCRSLADVAYYHQGRMIESHRIVNKNDGYIINGWECQKLDNHSGIVDPFRYLKGDPSILERYTAPLYLAVKLRKKVTEPGAQSVADIYIVNEKNIHGPHRLLTRIIAPDGSELLRDETKVDILGGDTFGQLLRRDLQIAMPDQHGYFKVVAELHAESPERAQEKAIASGSDEIFNIVYKSLALPADGTYIDESGTLQRFFGSIEYSAAKYDPKATTRPSFVAVAGANPFDVPTANHLLDRARDEGISIVALAQSGQWSELLRDRGLIKYDGPMIIGQNWVGGGFFVLDHPLFDGLPRACAMNWEYQVIQRHRQVIRPGRYALWLTGEEAAAGAFNNHEPRPGTTVAVVRVGKGQIILSTLTMLPLINNPDPADSVARRLLVNYLRYPVHAAAQVPTTAPAAAGAATTQPAPDATSTNEDPLRRQDKKIKRRAGSL